MAPIPSNRAIHHGHRGQHLRGEHSEYMCWAQCAPYVKATCPSTHVPCLSFSHPKGYASKLKNKNAARTARANMTVHIRASRAPPSLQMHIHTRTSRITTGSHVSAAVARPRRRGTVGHALGTSGTSGPGRQSRSSSAPPYGLARSTGPLVAVRA